ncbi:MAG: aminopeptidase [Gammaproteobacteria bacterium]|nr:aminopeptidase [Gammaproteobacteria bacterium]MCP5136222.1 aminopeptidase [Gammaproteobacteria bacterium]
MRRFPSLLIVIALLTGCADLGYYAQAVNGQLWVLSARKPVQALIDDPATSSARRARLRTALAARSFASTELGLPDNDSYRVFSDLKRSYVVWNVVATPPLSLSPRQSCFPITGCLSYLGWFSRERAEAYADARRAAGDDVFSGPVDAYSTLGWFDDPLLNTMLAWDEADMVAIVFHELAHQRVYIADDSAFNESYATTVERVGMRRWLSVKDPEAYRNWRDSKRRDARVRALLRETRDALHRVYTSSLDRSAKQVAKRDLLDQARARYRGLRGEPGWDRRYDAWFGERLNNALLAVIDTYHRWVPAFEAMLRAGNDDFEAFHAEVARIGRLDKTEREAILEHYLSRAPSSEER